MNICLKCGYRTEDPLALVEHARTYPEGCYQEKALRVLTDAGVDFEVWEEELA